MSAARARVLVLGCGFGGLAAARGLARSPVDVVVIDRVNHHLFQPLLYQVATAGLSAPAIAEPIRQILEHQRNTTVLYGEARRIDRTRRSVELENGETLGYDYLIVATGATHSYFGNDQWARHAPGLKTLEDAFEIRRRVLLAYEHAEREPEAARRRAWLSFVVIGAGATGVELAGTMAEIARQTLRGEYRRFDPRREARVLLVEASDRVLPPYAPELSRAARAQLERLGVTVRLGARVTGVDADGVDLSGERIAARTVLWAAGVAASPLGATLGVERDRAGGIPVEADLSIAGDERVFVIGDLARLPWHAPAVPAIAPAAKQMGAHAARNVVARVRGDATQPFRYRDYGSLATIGRSKAVAQFRRVQLSGFPAWLVWLVAHIWFLIGFRNRFVVMLDWAISYFTFERHARIVAEPAGGRRTRKAP